MTAKGKLIRNAVIAVVALALLSVGYYAAVNWTPEEKSVESNVVSYDDSIVLLNVKTEDVQAIKIKMPDLEYSLVQDDKGMVSIPEYAHLNFRQLKLKTALSGFGRITAKQKITEDLSRMEEFGLTRKDAFIAVSQKDGTTQRIWIGDPLLDQTSYYCMVEEGDGIYVLHSDKADMLKQGLESYREKMLLSLEEGNVEKFSVHQGGTVLMEIRPVKEGEKTWNSLFPAWIMEKPYSGYGGRSDLISKLLQKFSMIEVSQFVEDDPKDLGEYGLGKDAYTITILTKDGKNHSIKMGKCQEDGAYIQWNGESAVYFVAGDFAEEFSTFNPSLYAEKFVRIATVDDLATLTIEKDGKTCTLEIGEGEDENPEKFKVNGVPRSASTFKDLFQKVIGVFFTEVVEDSAPKGEPFMTASYRYKDGTTDTVWYYDYSERDYVAKRTDGTLLTVLKTTMEPLLEALEEELE